MGSRYSSPGGSKSVNITESEKSARNVLEKIGLETKGDINRNANKYEDKLKGTLKEANFYQPLLKATDYVWSVPNNPCDLDYIFHTNVWHGNAEDRHPCLLRDKERFSKENEAECNGSRISGNRGGCGACASYRRRHMCDYNLEYINEKNVLTTHDLLGNVLVMAKSEGDSIVKSHENTDNGIYKSGICISLARSFADIGDIVRGKDLYLGKNESEKKTKEKLQGNLEKIFEKIKTSNTNTKTLPLEKVREYWWALNRNDVWNAITCSASEDDHYFMQLQKSTQLFSNSKCGHNKRSVPTNLDYVPQFLRWFDEWAEDFCRIKKIKIDKIKKACRGENDQNYCDGNGYDCKQTDLLNNVFFVDLKCPSCADECKEYIKWIENKKNEFNKQKKKYEKEIKNIEINSDQIYDKKFYNNLKRNYPSVEQFVEMLKEGAYCSNGTIEGKFDFNKQDEIFGPAKYCASCPVFGVNCKKGDCNEATEKKCNDQTVMGILDIKNMKDLIKIDILVTDKTINKFPKDLDDDCKNAGIFKGIRNNEWSCGYLCNLDVCELKNFKNNIDDEKNISIRVLFKRWLENFLKDYNRIKDKISPCINNGKQSICINECKNKCVCVEKWIDKKSIEWDKVKNRYIKQYDLNYSDKSYVVKTFLQEKQFEGDVKKAIEPFENLNKLQNSSKCTESRNSKNGKCENNDVINILLNQLTEKINDCKKNHDKKSHQYCCDLLPESKEDDEVEEEEGEKKRNSKHLEVNKEKKELDDKHMLQVCEEVKKGIVENGRKQSGIRCNPKGTSNIWNCDTQIHINNIGACMPPRRKSLCIRDLRDLADYGREKSIDDYKNAFVKCASIETYLLWQKYKTSNRSEEDKLKVGEIPEDFRRIMYYTFGDYRDIFFGTDISSDQNIKNISKKIKALMEENDSKATGGKGENLNSKLQSAWEEHKRNIWKGMLCGITYDIKAENKKENIRKYLNNKYKYPCDLETFSKKPQFLRWFMEWSEDYCRNYTKELEILQTACSEVDCKLKDKKRKKECKTACEKFNTFVNKWKGQYRKQKQKYENEKSDVKKHTEYNDYVNKEAYEYLNDNCLGRKCECIEKVSEDTINKRENIPLGFDNPPKDYVNQCSCYPNESACANDELPAGRSEHQMECKDLNNNGGSDRITIHENKKKDLVGEHSPLQIVNFKSMYFPPRVKQLCVKNIGKLNGTVNESIFVKELQKDAYNEAKQLYQYYVNDGKEFIYTSDTKEADKDKDIQNHTIENMKRSYADYADLIKGKTKYNLYDNYDKINRIIKRVVDSYSSTSGKENKRETFWEKYKADVWNAMLCGYKDASNKKFVVKEYMCTLPNTDNEEQFARWFTEWAENFCIYKKLQVEKMEQSCNFTDCNKASDEDKIECHALCKKYKNWIEEKQHQYQNQKKIYDDNYKEINNNNKDINQFLKVQCKNQCDCISNNISGDNKDNVFEEYPKDVKEACKCDPVPGTSIDGSPMGHLLNMKNLTPARPVDADSNGNRKGRILPDEFYNTMYPMNCAEKAANELRKNIEININDVKSKLMGTKPQNVYRTKQNFWSNSGICTINSTTGSNGITYNCDGNENSFDEEKEWACTKDKNNATIENMCLPPRRKHMCTKLLENLDASITTTDELFKEVLRTAVYEGNHLKKQWEKVQTNQKAKDETTIIPKTKRYELCDAMKYSFADLADIVRGTDKYKNTNGNSSGSNSSKIEERLKSVFQNIQKKGDFKNKYPDDTSDFFELRSAWWNANRKEVWKAITCSAPDDFQVFKKIEGQPSTRLTEVFNRCGHYNVPPIDDYIPQGFRWIKEWSENYCKVQKKHLDDLRNECGECNKNNSPCWKNQKGKSCRKCQEKCKAYTEMIEKWKAQWYEQQKNYNQLYFSRKNGNKNGENHKEFLEKMKNECQYDPITADKFIDKASNCINITFNEPKHHQPGQSPGASSSYAFELPPKGYNVICGTTYRKSCLKLKRSIYSDTCPNKINLCGSNAVWKKLPHYNIYVPPRTQQLCLKPIETSEITSTTKYNVAEYLFFKEIQESVFIEAQKLSEYYKNLYGNEHNLPFDADKQKSIDKDKAIMESTLSAMKRSYADYGDLIKGTTKYEHNGINRKLNIITKKIGYVGSLDKNRVYLWNKHKSDIWHAMICGYNASNPNELLDNEDVMCKLPDKDTEDEFLRWFTEWTEDFCIEYEKNIKILNDKCSFGTCAGADNKNIIECQKICSKHKAWIVQKKEEYEKQKHKYNIEYKSLNGKYENAHEFMKDICKGKCEYISEKLNNDTMDKVFEEYPENVKTKCECYPEQCRGLSVTDSYIPDGSPFGGGQSLNECRILQGTHNKCPTEEICNIYNKKTKRCHVKRYDDYFSNWDSRGMLNSSSKNEGVLVPPRRRHICLRISTEQFHELKKKHEDFEGLIYSSAANEAQGLIKKYDNDNNKLLQAMKYSFADIGNVVKGDDMMESPTSEYIGKILGDEKGSNDKRITWWNIHKRNVWDVMLCAYKKATSNEISDPQWCSLPKEDETPQFLRWFQEWTENFCSRRNKLYRSLEDKCKSVNCNTKNGKIESYECKRACQAYENYVFSKKLEYHIQNKQYETNFKHSQDNKGITDYFKDKSNGKCNCLSDNFNEEVKWEKPYETLDVTLKDKCDCKFIQSTPLEPAEVPVTPSQNDQSDDVLKSTIPLGIAFALGSIAFLFMKKKPKSPVDLLRVLDIHKGDYGIPTKRSSDRYIPYKSAQYKGKSYIYMEGDTDEDKYIGDITSSDITSSESEYEELDINDIYVPGSPKYKTLIEVVLEPSKRDIPSDDTPPSNKLTDEEWNQMKHDFISNMLQNEQNDVPNNCRSADIPMNTQPNTLYFDKPEEKPFIMSIHDRDLYTGEEISYNINMSTKNDIPIISKNDVYSGIDLINDSLSGNKHIDIYDEVLKRKENELFGTHHTKNTSNSSVAKNTNTDPIMNQLDLLHKWLDRHRNMCEKWDTNNKKEELLDKLNEQWNKDNDGGDIYTSNVNRTLNTDVSIEIDMDNPKPINQFSNIDTNVDIPTMDNMEDDIYYDINDDYNQPSVDDIPMDHNKVDVDVPKKVHVEMKTLNNTSNGSLEQQFPISDVWNI